MNDVHTRHCCKEHGCKYGDPNCTVVMGVELQEFQCEDCDPRLDEIYYKYRPIATSVNGNRVMKTVVEYKDLNYLLAKLGKDEYYFGDERNN